MGRQAYNTRDLKPKAAKAEREVRVRKWVSKKVICRLHQMSPRYLEGLMKKQVIPFQRLSKRMVRYNPLDVEKALARFDRGAAS